MSGAGARGGQGNKGFTGKAGEGHHALGQLTHTAACSWLTSLVWGSSWATVAAVPTRVSFSSLISVSGALYQQRTPAFLWDRHIIQVGGLTLMRDQDGSQPTVGPVAVCGCVLTLISLHPSPISNCLLIHWAFWILFHISFVALTNWELLSGGDSWKYSPSLANWKEYRSITVHLLSNWHLCTPLLAH